MAIGSRSSSGACAVRLALLLLGGLYLVLVPLKPPGDGDLYWQRWLGDLILRTHQLPLALGSETFTAAGAPWVPQEWLFSLAVAVATRQHLFLLFAFAVGAVPLAILASIYLRSRGRSSPEAIAIVILFCGISFAESLGVRAQVLGWGCLAAFMLFLERRDRWYYATFPTAVVWANLHASVAIAPAIVFARVAATIADGGLRALRTSRDLYLLFAVVLATFCTPLGWRLPLLAVTLAHSPIRQFIQEWQPAGLHDLSFTFGALPLALAILLGGRATLLRDKVASVPAALLFAATLFAFRNTPLFAIVAAPLAARGLDVRFPRIQRYRERIRELEPAGLVAICVAIVIAALALVRIQGRTPPRLPVAAIASLAGDDGDHRLFCENFSWCSLALQYPTVRVFLDGRCDGYPIAVWKSYVDTIRTQPSWDSMLQRYGVDAVLASRGGRFATALEGSAHWRRAFSGTSYVLFRHD